MERIKEIIKDVSGAGAVEAMIQLGITSGEISKVEALKTYGVWFKNAYESGRLKPSRIGKGRSGTKWFSVKDILALRASDRIEAELQCNLLHQI